MRSWAYGYLPTVKIQVVNELQLQILSKLTNLPTELRITSQSPFPLGTEGLRQK